MSEFAECWLGSRLMLLGFMNWSKPDNQSVIGLSTMLEF